MKILPCGVAVIEHDTHISKWVEELGTLAIAKKSLQPFRKYIPNGSVVIDVGAMIGDHTITYADWVGTDGHVFAFEPCRESRECLIYNLRSHENVTTFGCGLSENDCRLQMNLSPNTGASFLSDSGGDYVVDMTSIDSMPELFETGIVSFIKIDAEGSEPWILRGGKNLIRRDKPTMLIEVNEGALIRAGASRNELLKLIYDLGYHFKITDRRLKTDDPQYDVICVHRERRNHESL